MPPNKRWADLIGGLGGGLGDANPFRPSILDAYKRQQLDAAMEDAQRSLVEAQMELQSRLQNQQLQEAKRRQIEEEQRIMANQGANRYWTDKTIPCCSTCPIYEPQTATSGQCGEKNQTTYSTSRCPLHPAVVAMMEIVKEAAREEWVKQKIVS